jgi:hypothetical protein
MLIENWLARDECEGDFSPAIGQVTSGNSGVHKFVRDSDQEDWAIVLQRTKAGYPGRKFRIPAHALLQLGVEVLPSCPSPSWRQRWLVPESERRQHRTGPTAERRA